MKVKKPFLFLLSAMFVSILLHFLIVQMGMGIQREYFLPIYLFVFVVFVITIYLIQLLDKYFHAHLGYMFLIIVALKLVSAKLFINTFTDFKQNEFKFSFLVLYLISLVLITWYAAQKLLKSER